MPRAMLSRGRFANRALARAGAMLSRMVCNIVTSPCGCHAFADGLQYRGPVNVTAKACRLAKPTCFRGHLSLDFPIANEPRKHGTQANHGYTLISALRFPKRRRQVYSPDRH